MFTATTSILIVLPALLGLGACSRPAADVTPPTVSWTAHTAYGMFKDQRAFVFPGPVTVRMSARASDDTDASPGVRFRDATGLDVGPSFDVGALKPIAFTIEAIDEAGNVTSIPVTLAVGAVRRTGAVRLLEVLDATGMLTLRAEFRGVFCDRLDAERFTATPLDAAGAPIGADAVTAVRATWMDEFWLLTFPIVPGAVQYRIEGEGNNLFLEAIGAPVPAVSP